MQCGIITPRSIPSQRERDDSTHLQHDYEALNKPKDESNEEQVISVRITSSVAVGRTKPKTFQRTYKNLKDSLLTTPSISNIGITTTTKNYEETVMMTEIPPNLVGANIEFIRQLNAKKEAKSHFNIGQVNPSQLNIILGTNETGTPNLEVASTNAAKLENDKVKFEIPTSFQNPLRQYAQEDDDDLSEPYIKDDLGINNKHYDIENEDKLTPARSTQSASSFIINQNQETAHNNDTEDTVAESSVQSISTITNKNVNEENFENVPLARSVPFSPSSKNYIQGLTNKPPGERGNNPSLTTVSFNIVHDTPKQSSDFSSQSNTYTNTNQGFDNTNKFYEPPKVYSQPAKIYSEPAKFYSEPAKIYSEPAKVYSEPAKVYSEPAKIYSEPAKFYSPPASLHLTPEVVPNYTPWQDPTQTADLTTGVTTPTTINTIAPDPSNTQRGIQQSEKNYEVDEKVSIQTDGRSHGVQETTTEKCKQDNCKVGYVVEGRQYKKYRVEERTPDGFIVGEYGVVRNEDGALRGVRYTADSDASPRLIYDALMKFLQLK